MGEGCHIVRIGANLISLASLNPTDNVRSINIHCNNVCKIEGLENLHKLQSLDLSSNNISSISGLSCLTALTRLNLASNLIQAVAGIGALKQLTYINLSYNKITSLQGFVELHGVSSRLKVIELHGNCLSSIGHVTSCLQGIISLQHLVLQYETYGNPVVDTSNYRATMLSKLPQLLSLDRCNHANELVNLDDCFDVSELQSFESKTLSSSDPLEDEVTRDVETSSLQQLPKVVTPRIDALLFSRKSTTNVKQELSGTNSNQQSVKPVVLCSSTKSVKESKNVLDEPALLKTTSEDSFVNENSASSTDNLAKISDTCTTQTLSSNKKPSTVSRSKLVKPKPRQVTRKKSFSSRSPPTPSKQEDFIEKQTFLNLLKELETERERRWKAEQASRKLVSVVREMQSENCEGKSLQQVAADTAERLKQTLLSERNANDLLKQENQAQCDKLKELDEKFTTFSKQKQLAIHNLQNSLSNANAKISKLQTAHLKEKQDLEAKVSSIATSHDNARLNLEQNKLKLNDLQSLLVCREAEYRKSLSGMYSTSNADFRNAVSLELAKIEKSHQEEVFELKQRIAGAQTNFSNLESEFREALYIESERYNQVKDQYNAAVASAHKHEELLAVVTAKEEKCRSMLLEMTSIIKEQKARIAELSKCKEEMTKQYQDRIKSLHEENEENRKKIVQLELSKQEKSLLISKVSALQSVVDGLKEERKLWGHELAQQGSALSQDRGRLEMKIESLKAEVSSLKKDNERDLDCLRIKTKVVEDQTETIFKMKEALSCKDKEVRLKLEEHLAEQRRWEETIEDLTRENASLQEENLKLNDRKQQLKSDLSALNQDYCSLQDEHEKQKKRWLEKAGLLSKLELQLKSLNEAGKQNEMKLIEEKEDALKSLRMAKDKHDQIVTAYQEQLRSAHDAHARELESLHRDKREEVGRMEKKVAMVEEEMSELLREGDERKKFMEAKVERLKFMLEEFT